jgi:2-alkyl-3-oxoalkanoate reductase
VTGLVHRNPEIVANDGTRLSVEEWKPDAHQPGQVQTIKGDIARPSFGWNDDFFAAVAADHDLIIHSAALLRFDLSFEDSAVVNVGGTRHALALAALGGMAFLHISTAYVCGQAEGWIEEAPLLEAGRFSNGYEESKAAAEEHVRSSGLSFVIARPSIVVGSSETGVLRQFDSIYGVFKIIAEGRVSALPVRSTASLDLVPIDHVAAGIVALATTMDKASGQVFHLVAQSPTTIERFFAIMASCPQFQSPALVAPEDFDESLLTPTQRRMSKRLLGPYLGYFQRNPRFRNEALAALTGLTCAQTDDQFLIKLIDHCIEAGFLPAATVQQEESFEPI